MTLVTVKAGITLTMADRILCTELIVATLRTWSYLRPPSTPRGVPETKIFSCHLFIYQHMSSILDVMHWYVFVLFDVFVCIYNALVHYDYCSVVWGNYNKTLVTKLQKLQNRAARILTFSSYEVSVDVLFKILGWTRTRCTDENLTAYYLVYKSLNGLAPEYLRSKFTDHSDTSSYTLRDCRGKLAIPLPRTKLLSNSFSYSDARCS